MANGRGLTAAVISPLGTRNGATGLAAGDRAMVPDDQMSIASITKTLVRKGEDSASVQNDSGRLGTPVYRGRSIASARRRESLSCRES